MRRAGQQPSSELEFGNMIGAADWSWKHDCPQAAHVGPPATHPAAFKPNIPASPRPASQPTSVDAAAPKQVGLVPVRPDQDDGAALNLAGVDLPRGAWKTRNTRKTQRRSQEQAWPAWSRQHDCTAASTAASETRPDRLQPPHAAGEGVQHTWVRRLPAWNTPSHVRPCVVADRGRQLTAFQGQAAVQQAASFASGHSLLASKSRHRLHTSTPKQRLHPSLPRHRLWPACLWAVKVALMPQVLNGIIGQALVVLQ